MAYAYFARQGNTLPVQLTFEQTNGDPFDLTGHEFIFRVVYPGGSYTKTSADGDITIDLNTATIRTQLTAAETRVLPVGGYTQYEVEAWYAGEQTTWLDGTITVSQGINTDE
jgi:hypothetical protein